MITCPQSMNGEYPTHHYNYCIDAYKEPEGNWLPCPCCGLKPKVWIFDNGRSTACGCFKSNYDYFSIHAESIGSVFKRTGGSLLYNRDDLRKNWNYWCTTGEVLFEHAGLRDDGRW